MLTVKQAVGLVLLIVTIVLVLSYPVLLGNFLNEKFGAAFVIKTIDNLDAEYFSITEWRISNSARAGYVFPYDKLNYHATITSKVPYHTIVNYILEINSGDSNSVKANGILSLNPHSSGEIPLVFSTEREGYHDVKLTINMYNGTDYDPNGVVTALDQEIRITKLDVLSSNDKLLAEQNVYVLLGVGASSVIGAITLYVLWEQRKIAREQITKLKESNDILQDQFKRENRPWIAFDNDVEHQVELESNSIRINMKNLGKSVAHDVHTIGLSTISEMSVVELLKYGMWDKPVSFAPNEPYVLSVDLPKGVTKLEDLTQLYVGVFARYKIGDSKYGAFIMITFIDRKDKKNDLTILRKLY